MRAVKRLAAALPWMTLLAACSGAIGGKSLDKGKVVDQVPPGEFRLGVMSIGQAKDVDYARAEGLGLVPSTTLDAYLNGVLVRLLAQSPAGNVPAHVYVRASGDWGAKTTADANIYVNLGTLLRLDNEDEVAALLAHELSHVILGHPNADIVQDLQQRSLQLSTVALAVQGQVTGTSATKRGTPSGDAAHVDDQVRGLLVNTMITVPAWNRQQEREADLLSVDLLVRAGYNPQGAVTLLQKQAQFESKKTTDAQAQYFEKQLSSMTGIDLGRQARTQTKEVTKGTGASADVLTGVLNAGVDQAMAWGGEKLEDAQRSHPQTAERLTDVQAYLVREYPGAKAAAAGDDGWEAAKDEDQTADLLESYIAAIEAQQHLFNGDVATAAKLSKSSTTGAASTHAYPNYVAAAVQVAQGSTPAALKSYETAMSGPEPAGAIYVEASALYFKSGKRDTASEVINSGYQRLQEPPSLVIPMIRTYRALGKQTDADRLATQCALRWPKLEALCRQEASGTAAGMRSE